MSHYVIKCGACDKIMDFLKPRPFSYFWLSSAPPCDGSDGNFVFLPNHNTAQRSTLVKEKNIRRTVVRQCAIVERPDGLDINIFLCLGYFIIFILVTLICLINEHARLTFFTFLKTISLLSRSSFKLWAGKFA